MNATLKMVNGTKEFVDDINETHFEKKVRGKSRLLAGLRNPRPNRLTLLWEKFVDEIDMYNQRSVAIGRPTPESLVWDGFMKQDSKNGETNAFDTTSDQKIASQDFIDPNILSIDSKVIRELAESIDCEKPTKVVASHTQKDRA